MLSSGKQKCHQIRLRVDFFSKKKKKVSNFRFVDYYQTRTFPKNKKVHTKGETKKPPSHLVINWPTLFLFILHGQLITNIRWLWSLRVGVLPLLFTSLQGGGRGGPALLQPITSGAQSVLVLLVCPRHRWTGS